jgi:hypothetical protein
VESKQQQRRGHAHEATCDHGVRRDGQDPNTVAGIGGDHVVISGGQPTSIAISGPDNVGKTTQIRVLTRRMGSQAQLSGPLDEYDLRWSAVKGGGMADWWFHRAPMEEVTDVLASSYLERSRAGRTATTRFMDRGIPMLEASVAATAAVRERIGVRAAADRASELLEPFSTDIRRAEASEFGVMLLQDDDPVVGVARSLERERTVTETYVTYQQHLHVQLRRLVADGRFALSVIVGDRPILAIQNDLRRHLRTIHDALPEPALAGVQILALGGMSESGKSSVGEYLRTRHGHGRLKIGYLIEEAAWRSGIEHPYRASAAVRAELLVDSLDRYCTAHHFLDSLSVESLHDFDSTVELRKILGDQLSVLYLETSAALRATRGTAGPSDVTARDVGKRDRGAPAIARIADQIVDNDGTRLALERKVDRLVMSSRWQTYSPETTSVRDLGLPSHLELYLSALVDRLTGASPVVDLLAVTGSGARGKFQHGWSDLDVFVVADQRSIPHLRDALDELRSELGGVKLGLTVLTSDECRTGAVTSRLLHVLTLIGSGKVAPLWCAPDFTLLAPDSAMDVEASVRDGIQAAVEIRRQLLRATPALRDLYKVTALLAKIMLRFEGIECPSDDDALAAYLRRQPEQYEGLQQDARTVLDEGQRLAAVVLNGWLSTLAPTTGGGA